VGRAQRAQEFRQSLDVLRGRGVSGDIRVAVDATGLVLSLDLPDDLSAWRGRELSEDILGAVRAAQADVSVQVRTETEDAFGADSTVARRMRDELASRFAPTTPAGGRR
jgi:phage head maturation protease